MPAVFENLNAAVRALNALEARVYQPAARPPEMEVVGDPQGGGLTYRPPDAPAMRINRALRSASADTSSAELSSAVARSRAA